MKQLSSFMILNVNGGDRVSFTYDEINDDGEPISTNNKKNFFVVDNDLKTLIDGIREYIRVHKLSE